MTEKKYLSDEELEKLILEVEAEKLINAPPDLLGNILASIEESGEEKSLEPPCMETKESVPEISKPPRVVDFNKKKSEFRRYCCKVISSMAATIALLILVSCFSGMRERALPSKEDIIAENVQTREAVTGNSGKKITSTMNESHVFSNMWKFGFFE